MAFPATAVRFRGETLKYSSKAASGGDAVRNSCLVCGSMVFGGVIGKDKMQTIYAGSLDDPSLFHPTVAVFTNGRPDWALIPAGIKTFDRGY
jgi:hypothetical protein